MLHKETKTNKKTRKNCASRIVRSSHCNNSLKVRPFKLQVRFGGSNQLWLVEFLRSHFEVARIFQTTSPKKQTGQVHVSHLSFHVVQPNKTSTMRRDSWGVVSWRTRQCARPRRSNGFLLPSNDLSADIGYQAQWSQEVVWYTSGVKRYGWTPQFITPRLNKKGRPKFLRTKLLDFGFNFFGCLQDVPTIHKHIDPFHTKRKNNTQTHSFNMSDFDDCFSLWLRPRGAWWACLFKGRSA